MSLKDWVNNGWLRPYKATRKQIFDLFAVAYRDIEDAAAGSLSNDWKFGIAYNAVLKLCTILLYAEGYRPEATLAHFRTFQALTEILGAHMKGDVAYLNECRNKRNKVEYDMVGLVTPDEARELLDFANEFKGTVETWLQKYHPQIVP